MGNPGLHDAQWQIGVAAATADFDRLETPWKQLLTESNASVFQTFEWQRTWWKHFGEGRRDIRLHVVSLRCNGQLIAIAPMCIERRPNGEAVRTRRLAFIGRAISDYLDVVVRRGWEAVAYSRIADHFIDNRHLWDVILMEDIPDQSPTRTLLHAALTSRAVATTVAAAAPCPRVALPQTWSQYYEALSSVARKKHRERLRQATADFDASFETVTSQAELRAAITELIELHHYRRLAKGERSELSGPSRRGFQLEVCEKLFANGWLRLNFMRLRGRRLAASCCFSYRNDYSVYLLGMGDAGEATKLSPGILLNYYAIGQAIHEGKHTFDFLRGPERFKYELLGVDAQNWTLTAYTTGGVQKPAQRGLAKLWGLSRCWRRRMAGTLAAWTSFMHSRK